MKKGEFERAVELWETLIVLHIWIETPPATFAGILADASQAEITGLQALIGRITGASAPRLSD